MANKMRGEMELDFGGKTYTIKPTMDLIEQLEESVGGLLGFADRIADKSFKTSDLVKFLVVLFRDAGLSKDEVFEKIMEDGHLTYLSCVMEFLNCALMGRLEKAPKKEGEAPAQSSER